jgi:CRP-like cAMP-binding protein
MNTTPGPNGTHIAIRKLLNVGHLKHDEQQAFLGILDKPTTVPADIDIVRDGSHPTHSTLLVDGFACRYKMFQGGRRQIMSLQFGGDITDIHSYILKTMDHAVLTLTECIITTIRHDKLREVTEVYPNLTRVLWRDTLIEAAVFRMWLAGVGRKPAISRVAHFFCEQYVRMQSVGLAHGNSVILPITQQDIADSLGLSVVHANRVLQELRKQKLIELKSRTLTVLDWERLRIIGEFEPEYLHLADNKTEEQPSTKRTSIH